MQGRRNRIAPSGLDFETTQEASDHPIGTPHDDVDDIRQLLVVAALVEKGIRVDADAHSLARVGDVAGGDRRGDVVDRLVGGDVGVVEELEALLARVVRRRERVPPAESMAVGVGGALDHVSGAGDGVAAPHVKAGRKVPPLGGAVQLPAGDTCERGREGGRSDKVG